jgi:hypothetical protein
MGDSWVIPRGLLLCWAHRDNFNFLRANAFSFHSVGSWLLMIIIVLDFLHHLLIFLKSHLISISGHRGQIGFRHKVFKDSDLRLHLVMSPLRCGPINRVLRFYLLQSFQEIIKVFIT